MADTTKVRLADIRKKIEEAKAKEADKGKKGVADKKVVQKQPWSKKDIAILAVTVAVGLIVLVTATIFLATNRPGSGGQRLPGRTRPIDNIPPVPKQHIPD